MTGIKRRVDAAQDGERKRSKVKKQQNGATVASKTKSSKTELKQPKSALKEKEKKIVAREQSDDEEMPDVEDSEADEFSGLEDMDDEEDISPKEKKGDNNTGAPANKSKPCILVPYLMRNTDEFTWQARLENPTRSKKPLPRNAKQQSPTRTLSRAQKSYGRDCGASRMFLWKNANN